MQSVRLILRLCVCLLCWWPLVAGAQSSEIVLGQTTDLSGPFAVFARPVSEGIRATFDRINKSGGIGGRSVRLVVIDDGFDSTAALKNAKQLVEGEGAVALLAPSSGPATESITPYAESKRVPVIGPTQGVPSLRAFSAYRFYVRASYKDEVQRMLRHLSTLGIRRVGVAHYDNAFGQQGLAMVRELAKPLGVEVVGVAAISADADKTAAAARALASSAPLATILYSPTQPAIGFIRSYLPLGQTQFYALSVVSAEALFQSLGDQAKGVIVSQLFPSPGDRSQRFVDQCWRSLAGIGIARPSYAHLEGCAVASVAADALARAASGGKADSLVRGLTSSPINLGGFTVNFSADDRNGSSFVDLTMIGNAGRVIR
jgi:branched-chain amino acid transport system substrate-binding protein